MRKSIKRFAATGAAAALISGGMLAGTGTAFAQETDDTEAAPTLDFGGVISDFVCAFDFAGSLGFCDADEDNGEAEIDETVDESTAAGTEDAEDAVGDDAATGDEAGE
ncbi:hypothetical protein ONR57_02470 [Hoyosella sp. YIM 151337]|uniref:hypothetical protein n=1 Tax=Hoyosella sp. YIM 151337 TaxID=2992742 RepID=UPI0022359FEC|nr:hypothetical protein [Hoyosella sp. YIM 151337]MCW4352159.1 hypothetical protein [Hoyosella sp. YIM 151337]